ncbi:hypothetical protein [Nostoc sp.]|uniref:hypothetical protein n=1 Tax=Nostoc sp. TaxID=1180 RepID=UPI002FFD29A9
MRESVIYQDILQEGFAQGLKQALAQRIEQKVLGMSIKMINKGIDIETIVDFTGLTIEQVQQLHAKTLGNQSK